jgi:curved DNA-binding protein CbpA
MAHETNPTHYEILGVTSNATPQEIKQAYRKLVGQSHPDRGGPSGLFRLVTHAYSVLSDPDRRAAYDLHLASPGRTDATQEDGAREQSAREQSAREQSAREQSAREQSAREQSARERAARERAAREQAAKARIRARRKRWIISIGALTSIALVSLGAFRYLADSNQAATVALPTSSQARTSSDPAGGTTGSTESATTKPKPTPKISGSSATFKHFEVTVSRIARNGSTINVQAKVCVRRLPPDPQGDRTRISWDPWSIRTSSETLHPKLSDSSQGNLYPRDETYRVGECASGWIPFVARSSVLKVKYANGVGNVAVWDATNLDKKPRISPTV